MTDAPQLTALVLGASRSIGLAIVEQLADRGWQVVGTARHGSGSDLHAAADRSSGRIEVERADLTEQQSLLDLRSRVDGRTIDLLWINGAIPSTDAPGLDATVEEFTQVMLTNALGPMHAIAALQDLVPPSGTIAVMSSTQGSITLNTRGGYDVYRASKSALNQLMRSHAARAADDPRTLLLMNPGHVRTGLGGPGAQLTIEEVVPVLVDTVLAQEGHGGLRFLQRTGEEIPW
ncbi:SDR family NAD(P)-dependent oxidoreductase [Amnibacterium endophyticum]|uniref:SDR family NAD(P)-dependent oxidoreductase n=1 Tax=Amnibacterium endophyticum TaxID=2109337 RepID=A0ABW4LH43_9MICO